MKVFFLTFISAPSKPPLQWWLLSQLVITLITIIPICEFVNCFLFHFGIFKDGDIITIIERLLEILEKNSIKPIDLCHYLKINTSTMTNWKNRNTDPPAKYIVPICDFLKITPKYLLTGINEQPNKNCFDAFSGDAEWIYLIHSLPIEKQYEFKGELKGYLRRIEETTVAAGNSSKTGTDGLGKSYPSNGTEG